MPASRANAMVSPPTKRPPTAACLLLRLGLIGTSVMMDLIVVMVFRAAVRRSHEAGEHHGRSDQAAIKRLLNSFRYRGVGPVGQVHRQPELVEGHTGEIAHLRAAKLLLAVNLRDVCGCGALVRVARIHRAPRENVRRTGFHRLPALDLGAQSPVASE